MENKMCSGCHNILALSSFGRGNNKDHGNPRCKQCCGLRAKALRKKHPEAHAVCARKCWLKAKFGMTQERYEEMQDSQDGLCAICRHEAKPVRKDVRFPLQIDHDHRTGVVRELLCHRCNTILGSCDDDINVLERAISYLRKHKQCT